jgi:hypothetical protein
MAQYKSGTVSVRNGADEVQAVWQFNGDWLSASPSDTGTATGGAAGPPPTLVAGGESWTPNVHIGRYVVITSGSGIGQARRILSNTPTVLTVYGAWNTVPTTENFAIYAVETSPLTWTVNEVLAFSESSVVGELTSDDFYGLFLYGLITGSTAPTAGELVQGASSSNRMALNVDNPFGVHTPQTWDVDVSVGDIFTVAGDGKFYSIDAVTHPWEISLASNYTGTDEDGHQYAITRDFTPVLSIPIPQPGDIETAALIREAMLKVEEILGATVAMWASAPSYTGRAEQAARVNSGETGHEFFLPLQAYGTGGAQMRLQLRLWGGVGTAVQVLTRTATSITVAGTPWTPSEWIGWDVGINPGGTGEMQVRGITGNTNNTISWGSPLAVLPAVGDWITIMDDPNTDTIAADHQYVDDAIDALDLTQVDRKGDDMMGALILMGEEFESGTATGGSATTVVDSSNPFTGDNYTNYDVVVTDTATGAVQRRQIASNTNSTLTLTGDDLSPVCGSGDTYKVVDAPADDNEAATVQYVDDEIDANVPALGSWTALSYSANWGDFGGSYYNGEWAKDGLGLIHLRGCIKRTPTGGGSGQIMFTLPAGARPASILNYLVSGNGGGSHAEVEVGNAGAVRWYYGDEDEIHLEGIPPFEEA